MGKKYLKKKYMTGDKKSGDTESWNESEHRAAAGGFYYWNFSDMKEIPQAFSSVERKMNEMLYPNTHTSS